MKPSQKSGSSRVHYEAHFQKSHPVNQPYSHLSNYSTDQVHPNEQTPTNLANEQTSTNLANEQTSTNLDVNSKSGHFSFAKNILSNNCASDVKTYPNKIAMYVIIGTCCVFFIVTMVLNLVRFFKSSGKSKGNLGIIIIIVSILLQFVLTVLNVIIISLFFDNCHELVGSVIGVVICLISWFLPDLIMSNLDGSILGAAK